MSFDKVILVNEEEIKKIACPTGTLITSARPTAPIGFMLCDGSLVSRTAYADLFAAIGTTYGVGDGSTTFAIPDLVGAVPRGAGTSTGYTQNVTVVLGEKDDDEMQGHHHIFTFNTSTGGGGPTPSGTGRVDIPGFVLDPVTDGVNGTPRTGNETKMKSVGVNYFIKF